MSQLDYVFIGDPDRIKTVGVADANATLKSFGF
jgi:hypothetical protein